MSDNFPMMSISSFPDTGSILEYSREEKVKRTPDNFTSNVATTIAMFFLLIILVYNSIVASIVQVNIEIKSNSTTDQTLLTLSSNLGWISIVATILILIFLYSLSKSTEVFNLEKYMIYIMLFMMLVITMQGIFLLYVRGTVDQFTIFLEKKYQDTILASAIVSFVSVFLILMFYLIVGLRFFRD